MKRSGGVTAAAIVLFIGSGLLVLMAALLVFSSFVVQSVKEPNPLGPAIFYVEAGFLLALAGWGIATAVGILRLRSWARISILVMSGLAAAMMLLSSLGMLLVVPMMKQDPNMPSGAIVFVMVFELILLALPLAICIWWLILFSLKSVRMQFSTGTQGAVFQPAAAGGMPVVAMREAPARSARKIPVSIIVIAVFLLVGALFAGFSVPLTVRLHVPILLLGVLITGAKGLAAAIVIAALLLFLGIALLRRKPWSLDVTIAYAIFATLNALLFLVSSSRDAYFKIVISYYQVPPGLQPDFFPHTMRTIVMGSMALGILANLVALYFLWTRRGAYRAACGAR